MCLSFIISEMLLTISAMKFCNFVNFHTCFDVILDASNMKIMGSSVTLLKINWEPVKCMV